MPGCFGVTRVTMTIVSAMAASASVRDDDDPQRDGCFGVTCVTMTIVSAMAAWASRA
jgi:hypothetical protein